MTNNLITRGGKVTTRNIEIRLINVKDTSFILRLGNIDYHVSLINNKFSVNNLLSDSVTFAEEINVDL